MTDLQNIAYTSEYQAYRARFDPVFDPAFRQNTTEIRLESGYSLIKTCYTGQVDGYPVHAAEYTLINRDGNDLYQYRYLNHSGDFATIIHHSDGHDYMIFRRDLYGYSVLDLSTLQEFHYFPHCSLSGKETFIWTDVHYNPVNDIMAVGGCFWAAPSGVILVDFHNPMQPIPRQADLHLFLDPHYGRYNDIDFKAWDKTGLLLTCSGPKSCHPIIPEKKYQQWLK